VTEELPRYLRVAAYALCTDGHAILLTRIAPGATIADDRKWTLPGGGLDFGEDPRDGALRELEEETGLRGEIAGLLDIDSIFHPSSHRADGVLHDYHGLRILYRVRIVGGELRDEFEGTTDAARWVPTTDLATLPRVSLVDIGARLLGLIP
jgi:ADP-ribose pyrophosphatase YjhB (NUDIX family)